MKICMVTTFYPPHHFGGDGVFVYRLAQALAQDGHEIHIIHNVDAFSALSSREPSVEFANHPNVTVHALRAGGFGNADLLLTHQLGRPVWKRGYLQTLLNDSTIDVIHFHNISLMGGPAVLGYGHALKLLTLHEYWLMCPMHVLWRLNREACTRRTCLRCTLAGRRPPQLWRYTGAVQRAMTHVDTLIAPSEFVRQTYLAEGFRQPIEVIPHFLARGEEAASSEGSYDHRRPYFLFVGRLEKLKGLHTLLDCFRTYDAADLVIIGTGTYEGAVQAMAADLPHVHFIGFVDHRDLKAIYERAIAVIVPSLCYETFGLVAIEAFAARTPAIVRAMGALPEVVQLSGGGMIYRTEEELLDAMESLRMQPELRARMGAQGYQSYCDHFTERQHLSRYYAAIEAARCRRNKQEVPCQAVSR